jgi:hypothetical protein
VVREATADGVHLTAGNDVLVRGGAPCGEVGCFPMRVDRVLIGVDLVEDEVQLIGDVLADVEVEASGFIEEGAGRVLGDRGEEVVEVARADVEGDGEGEGEGEHAAAFADVRREWDRRR